MQGLLKKGDAFPTEIAKAELRGAFLKRMLPQTRLTRGTQEVVKKGILQPVQISVEKRRGNKVLYPVLMCYPPLLNPVQLHLSSVIMIVIPPETHVIPRGLR